LLSLDGKHLLGGVLVGDASDFGALSALAKAGTELPCAPHELVVGRGKAGAGLDLTNSMADDAQVCSCNNISKRQICESIRQQQLDSVAAVKQCTRAGTGCGGCVPMVTDLFHAELKKSGKTVCNHLCEHFKLSRTELFALIKIKELKTFA